LHIRRGSEVGLVRKDDPAADSTRSASGRADQPPRVGNTPLRVGIPTGTTEGAVIELAIVVKFAGGSSAAGQVTIHPSLIVAIAAAIPLLLSR